MSSVSGLSPSSFDSDLTDSDFDPLFALVYIVADLAEEMTNWYGDAADELETASDWFIWWQEVDTSKYEYSDYESIDEPDPAVEDAFIDWMYRIGVDVDEYFFTHTTTVGGKTYLYAAIEEDYDKEDITDVLAIAVDTIATDCDQAGLFAQTFISDYNDGSDELRSLLDTVRSATRAHVNTV